MTATAFLDTALGQRLLDSLKSGVPSDISVAVGEIRRMVWDDAVDASLIGDVLQVLQEHRRFEDVIAVAEAAWAVGAVDTSLSRRYCQSLIETGALHAAELVATGMEETCDDDRERGEAFGLIGRIHKERFIAGGRPADLLAAIDSCLAGYRLGTDPLWHGVNLVALASRAERDGIAISSSFDVAEVTASVLERATARHPDLRSVWERATEIECLLAGEVSDAALARATTAAESLATARLANPFELQALRRQLVEVWELPPQHPVLLAIADRELQLGAGAEVELPESAFQLEKIFGTALPVGYRNLARGLSCAESVCKITDRSEEPWGTGFLVSGALIHPDLGEKPILVTNAHVVSPEPGVGKLLPGEARAAFDVTKSTAGQELVITGLESVWSSPPGRCDVTFLEFAGPDPVIGQPVEVAAAPPPVTEGAYVYVIGHPAGGGLKFSIRGNDLLAYDTALAKVHYTAPTEGGSSGSPVFNTAWELMAVHHAGDSKMRRLDDTTNTYQANEGITIQAIREEYAHDGR